MSEPARNGTCLSASAEVRVKRGSTWKTFAPRSLASTTHWNPTGWASAMFEPMITMQSEFCRSCWKSVAPPRPNEVPRPGTVEECHMRAWFSICSCAQRREQLIDEVVLLVVQRRAAEVGEAERPLQATSLGIAVVPGPSAGVEQPVGDHVHRRLELELLPPGPVWAPVLDLQLAPRVGDEAQRGRALRA